ncbi:hypothetical protein AAGG74_17490 [Bacillus mexicanus]|uniref:hypothetical protein n=1 Tax=Bacillus mexicanus TaxID=2834415 RepID=UPI003D21A446
MIETITSKEFETLVDLFEKDAANYCVPEHWVSHNRLFISSGVNEFILKINATNKELVIGNIQFKNKESGVALETLEFLTKYANKNGFEKITLDCIITEEMKKFALENGFEEKENNIINLQKELIAM